MNAASLVSLQFADTINLNLCAQIVRRVWLYYVGLEWCLERLWSHSTYLRYTNSIIIIIIIIMYAYI